MNIIPVHIISGFLGSGKTTSIIRLLKELTPDDHWAVIINEFGKISIDSQTLRSSESSVGNVYDISGGCICCSAKIYFRENLEKIADSGNYDRIIIEPSGLGGIEMVSEIVEAIPYLRLMPVICLVDITGIVNPRLLFNPIYQMQIRKAAIIAFSKCDLVNDIFELNRREAELVELFPDKMFWRGILTRDFMLALPESDLNKPGNKSGMSLAMNHELTSRNYQEMSYLFKPVTVFDVTLLSQLFSGYPSILRAKGFILTISGWKLYNYTLTGFSSESCEVQEYSRIVAVSLTEDTLLMENLRSEIEMYFSPLTP